MVEGARFLNLIRVLFPKWSFFDQVGTKIVIEAKPRGGPSWIELSEERKRPIGSLFHNPDVNLQHAIENLLHEFVRELQPYLQGQRDLSESELAHILSYLQIREWMALQLKRYESAADFFQFRLKTREGDVFFVSHEFRAGET